MNDEQKELLSNELTEIDKDLMTASRVIHDLRWRVASLEAKLEGKDFRKKMGIDMDSNKTAPPWDG